MIRSMTGFGRAEVTGETCSISIEARSANHRHLDIALRLPRVLATLEVDARRLIQSRLERGRVEVTASVTPISGESRQRIAIDTALARRYIEHARELAAELGVPGDPTLTWVLDRPGVVRVEDDAHNEPVTWALFGEALSRALDDLVARRTAEGEVLAADLRALVGELGAHVDVIASRAPVSVTRRTERLRERLRALLEGTAIDETRIVTEAVIWADKTDVTEELGRLRAHLAEVRLMLDKGGPVGRAFDFLIQELNREVNTIAAKGDDLELAQATLAAKSTLEKMREQVQNLE